MTVQQFSAKPGNCAEISELAISTMFFSDDATSVFTLVSLGLLCYLSFSLIWRSWKLPPGPTPLPVIGNLLQLFGGNIVTSLLKLREKYGEVFTIYLGSRPVVVFTGYKAVREMYVDRGDDFLARGDVSLFSVVLKNNGLVITSDVGRWRELRRFSQTTMRNLGMGNRKTEDHIREEAQCLVEELKRTKGLMFDPQHLLVKVSGNIIHSILFGSRHDYSDPELSRILHCAHEAFTVASSGWGQLFEMLPGIMRFLPGKHQTVSSHLRELKQYVKRKMEGKGEMLDPDNPRDYLEAFLIKLEKDKNNSQSEYNLSNLENSVVQIFLAGADTTGTTLAYALLIFLKYPEVLTQVYEEIEHAIGYDRLPKSEDQNQMPYTEALLHEIQRFINVLPLGLPRKTTRDVEFRNHFIPKGTNIYPLLTSVLRDPTCFPYPNEFDPRNFLDEDNKFKKNDAFMALAAGKRNCLGESLARMELFIFITALLQNFRLQSDLPKEDLDLTPDVSGIGNIPKPFKMSFIPR